MLRTLLSSIHSSGTICPLQVTKDVMLEVLHVYQVSSDFLPVLYSFGCAPHVAEGSSNNLAVQTLEDGSVRSESEQGIWTKTFLLKGKHRNILPDSI